MQTRGNWSAPPPLPSRCSEEALTSIRCQQGLSWALKGYLHLAVKYSTPTSTPQSPVRENRLKQEG